MTEHDLIEGPNLSARVAHLTPQERAALARKLKERRAGATAAGAPTAIGPRTGAGPWPLSYAQELMWLVSQLTPGTVEYNSTGVRWIRGPLDVPALGAAVQALVDRHEVLRTNFVEVDGQPRQVVHPTRSVPLPVVDATPAPGETAEDAVDRLVTDLARRPFDLADGALLRTQLVHVGPEEHVFVNVFHHIVSDGWSRGILYRELADLYAAFRAGLPDPLPPVALQYADYAVWQREQDGGPSADAHRAYWREHLRGAPALLELPTDRPRPARPSHNGARARLEIDAATTARLRALGQSHGATLFMTMLAAYGVLLSRITGQDDVVVGTPTANRTRPELEGLLGYLSNTLALRIDLREDPTFAELLARVRATVVGAFEHQETPFETVVQEAAPTRDLSYSPLFQVMFVVQTMLESPPDLEGTTTFTASADPKVAKFDLTFGVRVTEDGLRGGFEYTTDLFDAETVAALAERFVQLAGQIAADPGRRVSAYDLVTAAERAQLDAWNDTAAPEAAQHTLVDLFERQVDRTPTAPALDAPGHRATLTYAELDAQANQLAHHLAGLGVTLGTTVALYLDRRPELATAILGVLKAGGACLPLDPAYPSGRRRRHVGGLRGRRRADGPGAGRAGPHHRRQGAVPRHELGPRRARAVDAARSARPRPTTSPT